MKVSIHAAERFLQRVISKANYSCFDVNMAIAYLEKALKDVVPRGNTTQFVLPGFENFRVVYRENSVITIIPKGDKHVR